MVHSGAPVMRSDPDVYGKKLRLEEVVGRQEKMLDEKCDLDFDPEEFSELQSEADELIEFLDEHESDSGGNMRTTTEEGYRSAWDRADWEDGQGNELNILKPGESLRSADWRGPDGITADEIEAGKVFRGLATGNWRGAEAEQRALAGNVSPGSLLLPEPIAEEFIQRARAKLVLSEMGARTVEMTSKSMDLVRVTGDPTVEVREEGDKITKSDPSFERANMVANSLAARTAVSRELVEDAPQALGEKILDVISSAIAVKFEKLALVNGGGSGEPFAIAEQDVNEVDQGGSDYSDFDKIIEAVKKLKQANYNGPTSALGHVRSPDVEAEEAVVKDSNNQYLERPDMLTPINRQSTEAMDSDSKALVGPFQEVLIGVRKNVQVEASTEGDDAFEKNEVQFRGIARLDSIVARPSFFTLIKNIGA